MQRRGASIDRRQPLYANRRKAAGNDRSTLCGARASAGIPSLGVKSVEFGGSFGATGVGKLFPKEFGLWYSLPWRPLLKNFPWAKVFGGLQFNWPI